MKNNDINNSEIEYWMELGYWGEQREGENFFKNYFKIWKLRHCTLNRTRKPEKGTHLEKKMYDSLC